MRKILNLSFKKVIQESIDSVVVAPEKLARFGPKSGQGGLGVFQPLQGLSRDPDGGFTQ